MRCGNGEDIEPMVALVGSAVEEMVVDVGAWDMLLVGVVRLVGFGRSSSVMLPRCIDKSRDQKRLALKTAEAGLMKAVCVYMSTGKAESLEGDGRSHHLIRHPRRPYLPARGLT